MLFLRIWQYLIGYVIIKIEGLYLERGMNLIRESGIKLWGLKRTSRSCIVAKVSVQGYKRLAESTLRGCRITLVEKRGLPALWGRLKRRKALLAGAIAAILLVFILTSFIWSIEFEGDFSIAEEELLAQLQEMGVSTGLYSGKINTQELENRLMLKNPSIAWVDVRVRGVELNIEIKMKEPVPEMLSDQPQDIIASKDAVIESIVSLSGTKMVSEGQAVKKGDILISANVEKEGIEPNTVHARGEVKGRVFYSGTAKVSVFEEERIPTGRSYQKQYLKMGNWEIPVAGEKEEYENFDVVTTQQYISDLYFPVILITNTYQEVTVNRLECDLEQTRQEAEQQSYEDAVSKLPEDAIIRKVQTRYDLVDGEAIQAETLLEVIENIGIGQISGKEETVMNNN